MNSHPIANLMAELEAAVQGLPIQDLPRLRGELKRLDATAELRVLTGAQPPSAPVAGETGYLTVEEVVQRFHVKREWLYRHKKKMPHSQPSRKVLRFPEQSITKWFASRKLY